VLILALPFLAPVMERQFADALAAMLRLAGSLR
jgi:hypothetical protein